MMKKIVKRGRGRPRGLGAEPKSFENRFQRYYFKHREDLNADRRRIYNERKARGKCVRCGVKAVKGSVFCGEHKAKSNSYLKNRVK